MGKIVPIKREQNNVKQYSFRKKNIKKFFLRFILVVWIVQTILTTYYILK